jgi:creatinine amidohydrolase
MLLENLSYPEVEDYLKTKDVVLVPVGATEQHSPYGLLGTDFIAAQAVAQAAGERLQVVVTPTLAFGVSGHHMAFKGTVSLQPLTFIHLVCDVCHSLTTHGFQRIVFVNGHGGNLAGLQAALQQVKAERVGGLFEVICWYADAAVRRISRQAFGRSEGQHATPGEVSLTKFLRPRAFAHKASAKGRVRYPRHPWPLTATEMQKIFPDGRVASAPWLATAELGEQIMTRAVEALERKVAQIMEMALPE